MASNTDRDIGYRMYLKGTTLGERNFEPSGTVQYVSNHPHLNFGTGVYEPGQALPFDGAGGTVYAPTSINTLRMYFERGWIIPAS
jgi:hypothetical protein